MTNTPPNAGNTMPDAGEHTPGPWEWDENVHGIHITKPRDGTIPLTVARIAGSNDESLANARLIAAAPELLAELEYAVKLLAPFGETAQVQRMRQVVAKARGE